MKTKFEKLLLLIVLMNTMSILGQTDIKNNANYIKTLNIKTEYLADIDTLKKNIQIIIDKENSKDPKDIDKITKLQNKKNAIVFNSKFLNQFFSSEITSFATNIKDQSVEKYFINANTDNKSLSIGRSFDFRELFFDKNQRKLEKMANILTLYTQSGLDKGFSNFYEKNITTKEFEFSNNLGFGIRYTHFFNGIISYKDPDKVKRFNEKIIDTYVAEKIGSIEISGENKIIKVSNPIKEDIDFIDKTEDSNDISKKVNEYTEKKYYDTYKAIIDKQVETIKKEKLYSYYIASWIGVDFSRSLTNKTINSTIDSVNTVKNNYKDWRLDFFGNILVNYSCGNSIKLKGIVSNFNTNDFMLKNQSTITINDIKNMNGTTQILNETTNSYYGNYNEKNVSTARLEAAFLFLNNSIGVSGGYEKYLNYEIENWKIGIPFSLKDKEDKPTINFEIVWREVNKTHLIGINAAYSFGNFLK